MSDDLDLRGIDHRHEPDPQFRAALQRRVAAIVDGTDPGSVTEAPDLATIDLEPTSATVGAESQPPPSRPGHPGRRRRRRDRTRGEPATTTRRQPTNRPRP